MIGAKSPGHACRLRIYIRGFGLMSSFTVGIPVCYCCRLLSSNDSTLLYIVMLLLWNIFRIHIIKLKNKEFPTKFLACERSLMTSRASC